VTPLARSVNRGALGGPFGLTETRFPVPQISETRWFWHQLREYDRLTVPSLLRAGGGRAADQCLCHHALLIRVTQSSNLSWSYLLD
jgi:hypothetical protein